MTGNETKLHESKKEIGHDTDTTKRASEGDTTNPDHPGITYTKKGAMKQVNIRPPPSSSMPEPEEEIITISPHDDPNPNPDPDHPGIGHSKNGAMRQPNIHPPPSSSSHNHGSFNTAKGGNENTTGTYNFGTNLDTHPHVDHAGPDLTRTIPPSGEDDDLAIVQAKQDQEEKYDVDYDLLHGGFPTGAPSPGLRGRGAEVIDKFDR
jgi:hypothetical protein